MHRPTKLLNKNFSLLWAGQSISQLGIQGFDVALLLWIKHATDSATLMGLILMISTIPAVFLGPIGGTIADRYSRRAIIIVSDLLSGISLFALVIVMLGNPQATGVILTGLFIVSFSLSVIGAFFRPAVSAAIPDLVPDDRLTTANSLTQVTYQLAVFLGQGLGGMLFRLLGAPVLILLNGLTYTTAAAASMLITIPQVIPEKMHTLREQLSEFGKDIADGLVYVWHRPGLREMFFVSMFLNFFTAPIVILLPFFVEDHLKATTDWYGYLLAMYGIGSMIGYLLAGVLPISGRARSRLMIALMVAEAFGYGLLGLAKTPLIAVVMAFLGGAAGGIIAVYITTLMQITTPGDIRGRVFGLLGALSGSITPVAMGLSGIVADALNQNIPLIYMGCGIIMTALSILVSLSKDFRAFLAFEEPPAIPASEPNIAVTSES